MSLLSGSFNAPAVILALYRIYLHSEYPAVFVPTVATNIDEEILRSVTIMAGGLLGAGPVASAPKFSASIAIARRVWTAIEIPPAP